MKTLASVLILAVLVAPAAGSARTVIPQVQPAAFEHGARGQKKVALTFDACTTTREPSPYDPRITAELEAMHVPATVFVGGGWAQEEAPMLRELARDPLFEIGNHTFTHPHLARLSDAQIRDELLRTKVEIAAVTGHTPTLFRPPYGVYDAHVLRVAAELGLTTVEYDLPSGDPDVHATKQSLVNWVLREARPGSIIVMHINHRRFHTAEALPEIVAGLRARGFELLTVGELLRSARLSGDAVAGPKPARERDAGHARA
jgi:peptidoglycan/xylan/chitin deacetylase (PgdA/CDA1 family)